MTTTPIRISEETRERLDAFKVPGMSDQELIGLLLEIIKPEDLSRHYRDWQSRVAKEVRESNDWKEFTL